MGQRKKMNGNPRADIATAENDEGSSHKIENEPF